MRRGILSGLVLGSLLSVTVLVGLSTMWPGADRAVAPTSGVSNGTGTLHGSPEADGQRILPLEQEQSNASLNSVGLATTKDIVSDQGDAPEPGTIGLAEQSTALVTADEPFSRVKVTEGMPGKRATQMPGRAPKNGVSSELVSNLARNTPSESSGAPGNANPDAGPTLEVESRGRAGDLTRTVTGEAGDARQAVAEIARFDVASIRVRRPGNESPASGRLPQIGVRAVPGNLQSPDPSAGSALTRNSTPFDNPGALPLLSIILIHDGATEIDRSALANISVPVTIAIDPTNPGAEHLARACHDAGIEVAILANGLPSGATARDVEVTLASILATIPGAVAVLDPEKNGFGAQRDLTVQALAILRESGHGAIGWSKGLGTMQYRNAAQPVAMVSRRVDARDANDGAIFRALDRAAFDAVQSWSAVVVGSMRPETLATLTEWAQSLQENRLALAPVSAVLQGSASR